MEGTGETLDFMRGVTSACGNVRFSPFGAKYLAVVITEESMSWLDHQWL
jgi:hypothetical protein